MNLAGGLNHDFIAVFETAGKDTDMRNNAAVSIVKRVENKAFQRFVGTAFGRRHECDNGFEQLRNAGAVFGGNQQSGFTGQTERVFKLLAAFVNHGVGQVDFIDNRNDFQAGIDGEVGVGDGLGFDTLRGIHQQDSAFTGVETARDFIVEIHMAGGVNQVQDIVLAVLRFIRHADGLGFDGDAALTLQVHAVQHLGIFGGVNHPGHFQHAVGEGGFAVVDMGDDAKVSDIFHLSE